MITVSRVYSQTPDNFIILSNSVDTLRDIRILEGSRSTNEDVVCFIDKYGVVRKLNASDVKKYYNGTDLFYSFATKDKTFKLMSYNSYGILTLADSYDRKGNLKMYIVKDNVAEDLYPYRTNLNQFFKDYLGEEAFVSSDSKIPYNYKYICEFVSKYNSFTDPKKYEAIECSRIKILKYGALVGTYFGNVEFLNFDLSYRPDYAVSVGVNAQHHI
jgi:hypothetical protein